MQVSDDNPADVGGVTAEQVLGRPIAWQVAFSRGWKTVTDEQVGNFRRHFAVRPIYARPGK